MYATDKQTDRRQTASLLNVPPIRGGGIMILIITCCAGGRLNMPPPHLWPFDLESGVRVTCDVGQLYANFSLPRSLCSRLRPDVCDRQTSDRRV